jgi:probable F420-dependent oxidoreductase
VWLSPRYGDAQVSFAIEAEKLGYGTVWLGQGMAEVAGLADVETILDGTERITVATGIVNMWTNDPDVVAASFRRIEQRHPGRFLLGVGVSHPEAVSSYRRPLATMVEYLDRLDAGDVPRDRRILAALGPRALELAGERTAGTHPYLVVPEHSRVARDAVGPSGIVAPEQTAVLDPDPEAARALAREFLNNPYLKLRNYVANLQRLGYTEQDVADGGSDRLVDDLVPHGTAEQVVRALSAHLDAGADHVAIQALAARGGNPMDGLRALAAVL